VVDYRFEVIIIGTGAGGGTLAHRLAATGRRILLLERGGWLPRARDNWDSTAVFVQGRYRAPEFWYDRHGQEFPPEVNYYVDGNTKFYGPALFRLGPEQDTVEAAWEVVDPVLDDSLPLHDYPRGSWGPKEADGLLPDGDSWHDPVG
jgi:choline dehydrogenase-like flavoprotein